MTSLGRLLREHARAAAIERQIAIPVEVTDFSLEGEPIVTVRPMQARRVVERDGEVQNLDPLEIFEVPYSYPSSGSFAVFMPPEVGMQGFLMSTDDEIGEAGTGRVEVVRTSDKAGGFFVPSGNLSGSDFKGNANWAELRSGNARIAISKDQIHLQAGDDEFVLGVGGNLLGAGGFDLVKSLEEVGERIRRVERLVGIVDDDLKVEGMPDLEAPQRSESGVR